MRWPAYLIANLVMLLLAYLLAPFLPAFAIGRDHLPACLSWFDTPDNPLDGDGGFKAEHAPFKGEVTGWRRYMNRVVWLLRNPAYGFDIEVLGFPPDKLPNAATVSHSGGHSISGKNSEDGWYFLTIKDSDGKSAWQFFYIKHLTDSHCLRLNIGWKLWSWFNQEVSQFVFSFSPWKVY